MLSAPFSLSGKKVWVAGHNGMVGRAIMRALVREDCELLTANRDELDLCNQAEVERWAGKHKPDVVFVAAARVGGIHVNNTRPADFIYDNLAIETNVIHASYLAGVQKLLFLGSSCIYPKAAAQPITEEALMTGPLEPTNQWYAIAKIAGIMMCQAYRRQYGCDYISALPTNLYGPYDRFDEQASHVIPAMMLKFHRAKLENYPHVDLWGTGKPLREFLHVDELAAALVLMIQQYSAEAPLNIGYGQDIRIRDLAYLMAKTTGFTGEIRFDAAMPDGMARKLLDISKIKALGWSPKLSLSDGLVSTYEWFCSHYS